MLIIREKEKRYANEKRCANMKMCEWSTASYHPWSSES